MRERRQSAGEGRSRSPDGAGRRAIFALLDAASGIQRHMSRVVEAHGITLQQYNVLRILANGEESGVPVLTIAEQMVEQTPGITRLLDRLERKRLVRRTRSSKDRRRVYCRITPDGAALMQRMEPATAAAEAEAVGALTRSEQRTLVQLLGRLREDRTE